MRLARIGAVCRFASAGEERLCRIRTEAFRRPPATDAGGSAGFGVRYSFVSDIMNLDPRICRSRTMNKSVMEFLASGHYAPSLDGSPGEIYDQPFEDLVKQILLR